MNEDLFQLRDATWKAPLVQTAPALSERKLWVGDRLPDFVLPDPKGVLGYFYQTVSGTPTVLVLVFNTSKQDQWDEIKGFARLAPAFREAGADLFIVSNDGIESLDMVSKIIPEHARWFADIKGVVNLGLRAGAQFPFKGVVCFVLDGNQRVMAVRGLEAKLAEWAIEELKARPTEPPHRMQTSAPVLILPEILEQEDCRALLDHLRKSDAAKGSVPIGDVALAERITRLLYRRIGLEVEKAFGVDDFVFELIGFRQDAAGSTAAGHDAVGSSAAADRRREVNDPAVEGRSYFMLLDLDGAYEGGEVCFPEYAPHLHRLQTGGALVHAGTILRELRPVVSGSRSLLLGILRRAAKPEPQVKTPPQSR